MSTAVARKADSPTQFVDPRLMPAMPVLDELKRNVGGLHPSVNGLIGLQHLFGSTATLMESLRGPGIDPGNVFVLGKPYSANPRVVRFMQEGLGYWTHPDTLVQPNGQPNDELMDQRIHHLLDRVQIGWRGRRGPADRRYLLIDDGGRAIRLLHSRRYDDIRAHFTCVEQTRCGIRTTADLRLEVPVVNVAESWVKLEHESPLIASSVNEQLTRQLEVLAGDGMSVGRRVTVVGFGAIGTAVADEMSRTGFDVAVFDHDDARRASARLMGYPVLDSKNEVWSRGGIVIGCTGLPVMDRTDHDHIADGTLLISASSADVEFRAWQIRPRGANLGVPGSGGGRPGHPCFSLYRVERQGRVFHLLNGGFPVNFDGGVDTIAPDRIQLTRSLLLLGGVQASRTHQPGLHHLEDEPQEMLVRLFRNRSGSLAA